MIVPLYVAAGLLGVADAVLPFKQFDRTGLYMLLLAVTAHILSRMDQRTDAVKKKIDHSVGDVYEAGSRSERRRIELEAQPTAKVRHLVPRR